LATRGRKPKPTALKILGGARADRIPSGEPARVAGRPDPPAALDQVGRDEFDRLAALLEANGVLSRVDGAALGLYAAAFSRWQSAERGLQEFGLLLVDDEGLPRLNPLLKVAQESMAVMARLLCEFGATPSSRTRVKTIGAEAPADPLRDFLSTRKR